MSHLRAFQTQDRYKVPAATRITQGPSVNARNMQPTRRSCKTQEAAQVTLQRQTPASCCTSHAAASDAGLLPCTSQSQCEGPRANASHRLPTPRCAKIENTSCAIFRATVQPRSRSVALAAAASVLENGIYTACCTSHAAASDAGLLPATSRGAADSSHAPRGFWPLSAQLERCARARRAPARRVRFGRSRTSEMPAGTLRPQLCSGPVQSNR
jgi:hypothetical protein